MSAEKEQLEAMIRSYARREIVASLDILIKIIEEGKLKDALAILKGARNVIIKQEIKPLIDQMNKNLSIDSPE